MNSELRPERVTYKIERLVGEGLSARVYKAIREDSRGHSRQIVALKILKKETAVSWMRREFDTLARVHSPHCVRVLAWENLQEGCALVLEWIDGVTLRELAEFMKLSESAISEVVRQVQEGLRDLNEKGLFHGDLSPTNILIDHTGLVKIVDFTSATLGCGVIQGTPSYMAPEVWSGRSAGYQSDLFSLGLIQHDLKHGLNRKGLSIPESQERASRLSLGKTGLLHPSPGHRTSLKLKPSKSGRIELAKGVCKALTRSNGRDECTAVFENLSDPLDVREFRFRASFLRSGVLILVMGLAAAAPGRVEAPLSRSQNRLAALSIRSHAWIELWLNGKPLGYAPVDIKNLRPGFHRLKWKDLSHEGQIRISLQPGQHLRINEKNLRRKSQARNR